MALPEGCRFATVMTCTALQNPTITMSRRTKRSQPTSAFQVLADPCVYVEKNHRFVPARAFERKARQAPSTPRSCGRVAVPSATRRRVA